MHTDGFSGTRQQPATPSAEMGVQFTALAPGQERAAGAALAASHADYPAFCSLFPNRNRRARALLPFFTAAVNDDWYLVALGVRPGAQRTGLGSGLAAPVLQRARQEETSCYLETSDPSNVAFYERLGFRSVAEDLALLPGGPAHVAMRREADPT